MRNNTNIQDMNTVITRVRTRHGRWARPIATTLEELAAIIGSDKRQNEVEQITMQARDARNDDATNGERQMLKSRDQLPYIIFSALFTRRGLYDMKQPTGLMLVSIPLDGDSQRTARLRRSVEQLPQTVMAFTGVSRRTLKVVVRCTPANGPLPADSSAYLRFLCVAQQQTVRFLEAMCGYEVPIVKETLQRGCRLSQDGHVFLNTSAEPLTVLSTDSVLTGYPLAQTDHYGNTVSEPSWDDIEHERANFYACMTKANETVEADPHDPVSIEKMVIELAVLCRKSGLPEETCVKRTGYYRQWHLTENEVRRIFRTVYQKNPEGKPWSQMTQKEVIAHKVQEFFERRYELRFNVMKNIEEFRPRGIDYHPWQELTERDINGIGQEQMLDVGATWPIGIKQYAKSSIVPNYNPIHEFLAGCGTWNKHHDHIRQLARRIPCRFKEWPDLFHRWFLAMVAGWLGRSRDFANSVVPMLVGPQGCRKSTFCKLLLPHSLREYYIDDIKLDNAEQVERMLGRMALVNIDEYNAKTDREQAKIKRILTERDVQVRRMRSEQYTMTQRMASFIATTNERQPLNDPTGSRRYLCVQVTGTIDTETPINYQQLYAQAVCEIQQGEPYYMSREEETVMQQHNEQFQNLSTTEILLASYYQVATRSKNHFIRAIDILTDLQTKSRGADRPNMAQLLKALKAGHYEYGAQGGVRGWYAEKRDVTH
ncbi:MAG: hypothetical protein IJ533_02115 [Prevotella sp.]|nr:hypothetical protein [Prevotella sp.]